MTITHSPFIEENKNKKLIIDGLKLTERIPYESIDLEILDAQYRAGLDKLSFGNEGKSRMTKRSELPQMNDEMIVNFLKESARVLKPSSYLFLWVDKFTVAEGVHLDWMRSSEVLLRTFSLVDKIVWYKESFGMGARSRRTNEELLVYQKLPKTTKNWKDKGIRDTWVEKIENPRLGHPNRKPLGLTERLIQSVTNEGDLVMDRCSGSFSTFHTCMKTGRNFIGGDISPEYGEVLPVYED